TLEGSTLQVEVEATAVRDGDYSLQLLLLEDGIVAPQTGASDDYVHNDVLRSWTETAVSARKAGDVFSASFSLAAEGGSLRSVALVCRGGIVDNAAECKAGGSIAYLFEKQ
ncbi:MAG: Omp28-related outer membrane protein, partial [Bacteroidales bacterium]|nr:Omp28-related outer membrane protein [Bacteroidales bacterium]